MRINIKVIGGQVAPAPAKPASTTADALAGATATVTGAVPVDVAVPSPHSILFEKEGQTKSDQGDLVRGRRPSRLTRRAPSGRGA